MQTNYLVPVIAIVLLAAVSSTTRSSLAQGAAQAAPQAASQATNDECLGKPGATAPQGSHWYYRVNRTGRHCWYLGPEGTRARAREVEKPTRTSSPKPIRSRTAARTAEASAAQIASPETTPAQVTPARAAPTQVRPPETAAGDIDPGAEFATRWPDLASSIDLNARKPESMHNSFAQEHGANDAQDGMPLIWPVLTPSELTAAEPPSQSKTMWVYILALLSGALALAAMLLGAIGHRAAAREPVHAVPNMPRPRTKARPQFADALATALQADAVRSPIPATHEVDLAHRPPKPNEEASGAADAVEDRLQRLLHAWQRVAA